MDRRTKQGAIDYQGSCNSAVRVHIVHTLSLSIPIQGTRYKQSPQSLGMSDLQELSVCDEHRSMASAANAGDLQNPDRSSRGGTGDFASRSTYRRGTTDSVLPLCCNSNNGNAAKINGVRCGLGKTQVTGHTDRVSTRVDSKVTSKVMIKKWHVGTTIGVISAPGSRNL